MQVTRTPFKVSLSVWQALFMRDASARITNDRLGWIWIFLEPLIHIILFVVLRQLMGSIRYINGAEFIPWFIIGMALFLMFSVVMNRCMMAVTVNRALFAYRQVHPVDTVLVRALLEMLIKLVILILLVLGANFLGYRVLPDNVLSAAYVWLALWLFSFGVGLVFSVIVTMVQELGKIISLVSFPLYFLSCVMVPIQMLPKNIQEYLIYNPILHAVEAFRMAFFSNYQSIHGISIQYLMQWSFVLILLGLMLHIRYKNRLIAA